MKFRKFKKAAAFVSAQALTLSMLSVFSAAVPTTAAKEESKSNAAQLSESLVPYQCDEGWIDGELRLIHLKRNPLEDADSPEAQAAAKKANATKTIEHFLPEEGYMGILEKYKALDSKGEPRYSPEITKSNDSWEGEGWYLYKEIQEEAESSTAGTWAVDESLRFQSAYELRQSNMLPSPCTKGENGAYQFDENGLNAIKQELLQKRAVSISFYADQSMPGQTTSGTGFMNFIDEDGKPTTDNGKAVYWCQYTYDKSYDPSNPEMYRKNPIRQICNLFRTLPRSVYSIQI